MSNSERTDTYTDYLPSERDMAAHEHLPCPCCGHWTLDELGAFEICDVCDWEDDALQFDYPDMDGGANAGSLLEARQEVERRIIAGEIERGDRYEWPTHQGKPYPAPRVILLS